MILNTKEAHQFLVEYMPLLEESGFLVAAGRVAGRLHFGPHGDRLSTRHRPAAQTGGYSAALRGQIGAAASAGAAGLNGGGWHV